MDRISNHHESVEVVHNGAMCEVLDEAWSKSPAGFPNGGIRDGNGARDFVAGLAVGVIGAGSEFIEFLAHKDSVSDSLIAIGPALDKAVDYYADKVGNGSSANLRIDSSKT